MSLSGGPKPVGEILSPTELDRAREAVRSIECTNARLRSMFLHGQSPLECIRRDLEVIRADLRDIESLLPPHPMTGVSESGFPTE